MAVSNGIRIAAAELRRDVRDGPEDAAYVDDPATGDLMRAMRQLSPKARAAIYLHYQVRRWLLPRR